MYYYVFFLYDFFVVICLLWIKFNFVSNINIYMKKIVCFYKVWRDIIMLNVKFSVIFYLLLYVLIFFFLDFFEFVCILLKIKLF